jgi:hypothetical protein
MPARLPLKKLVVELRYKPNLGFYGKMDAVGIELAEEFPDWERSALTLEVRNKKKHRRLYLASMRVFYEADNADPDADFEVAEKLLTRTCPKLDVTTLSRAGIRQWFAADLGKAFAPMVDEFAERFLGHMPECAGILSDKTKDVAYVVDYETDDRWRYNLRMGPMIRSQWFAVVPHGSDAFERGDDAAETFDKFRQSFPEQFIYVDIDCYREDLPVGELADFMKAVRRRSHDLAAKLIDYCRK